MPPNAPRLQILSVGGNAVSAFLSWRLQATNACDVTLVWKSGFESVAQYGISFRSPLFGNERFKPRSVVRSPEDAAQTQRGAFDYVVLCVKALPDVYDIASVIETVVTPQHTCILINTSHSIGVESYIEQRFPKNVVLSLVSGAEIVQLGPAEFEHRSATELWVGPANLNSEIPASIQTDMAEALAMTLGSGQVDCKVSPNIQQQQFERMIGPIAFHSTSVIFETPNHTELIGLTGVRNLIDDLMDEVIEVARTRSCSFQPGIKEKTTEQMLAPNEANSVMYQDYAARRPMEVETYLGSPIKLAKLGGVAVPRLETVYALLHHVNIANQKRPVAPLASEAAPQQQNGVAQQMQNGMPPQMQRMNSAPPPRMQPGPSAMNGGGPNGPAVRGRGNRAPSFNGPPPPPLRRGPSGMGGSQLRAPPQSQQRSSFEGPDLDQFSHLYGGQEPAYGDGGSPGGDLAMRERELMFRQKELALREREMALRGPQGGGGRPSRQRQRMADYDDDDEDGNDYFDPMAYRGPPVDADNVDMMSITSRRNRKQSSHGQLRGNSGEGGGYGRPPVKNRNRHDGLHANLMDNPMMGASDNRYGTVDRRAMGASSRTNSLTAARLDELQQGPGSNGYPPMPRRISASPGNPFAQNGRPSMSGHPSQQGYSPNGPTGMHTMNGMNGVAASGRPSPDMRQPIPRYPPGHGNSVAPQQVEQRAGVSNLYPAKNGVQVRSLTGSASASAESGESNRNVHIDSETSAFSSQASLPPRPHFGVH